MRYKRLSLVLTTSGIFVWLLAQVLYSNKTCDSTISERTAVVTSEGTQEKVVAQSKYTYINQRVTVNDISHSQPGRVNLKELNWTRFTSNSRGRIAQNQYVVHPTWFRSTICDGQDVSCWDHCIPFKGEVDKHICSGATKHDLMVRLPGRRKHCHASVLHMLLDDFINITNANSDTARIQPLLTHGTLLGAFRNESIIPWTHDIDLAFFSNYWTPSVQSKLGNELRQKGYSLFRQDIWRVCLNIHHPLAKLLSNEMGNFSNAKRGYGGDIPYLDLYHLKEEGKFFRHAVVGEPLDRTTILPVRNLRLLGKEYDTINAPEVFFKARGYGDYMRERVEPHK